MGEPFRLEVAQPRTAVVVEVPHAGLELPAGFKAALAIGERDVRADADLAVDRLYARAPEHGAPLLAARYSRYVCDLNRDPDDVDALAVADHPSPRPDSPRGFVWRLTTEGRPALARPLTRKEWQKRVDGVWAAYHGVLEGLLAEAQAMRGFAILLSGHSMPSIGRAQHADTGRARADVVVGWRGGTSCDARVKDTCVAHFRARGYTVAVDDPYRGGATTGRYGQPAEGLHAVQVELSRALYMDERKLAVRDEGLRRVQGDADALVDALAALDLRR